jgi:hypothetical protein
LKLTVNVENVTPWGAHILAKVEIYAAISPSTSNQPVAWGQTDANGNFTAELTEGVYHVYTVIVRAEGFSDAKQQAKVASGRATELKVRLVSANSDATTPLASK